MKPALWRQAVKRYVVPDLPGPWRAAGWLLHAEPVGWLTRALVVVKWRGGGNFRVGGRVQLLAVPRTYWGTEDCDLRPAEVWWPDPTSLDEAEPAFRELSQLIRTKALPYFDAQATLEGRMSYLEDRVMGVARVFARADSGWEDPVVDEELVYVSLLRGDLEAVARYGEWAERASRHPGNQVDHAQQTYQRTKRVVTTARQDPDAAVAILRERATATAAHLKLSPPQV